MSEFSAKTLREKRKEKAARMGSADPSKKVDSSDWTPPEPLNADVKTGARPISRRAFKSGGKVCGEKAKANMGRAPRKSGGVAAKDYANAKVNRNVKDANEEREGKKHIGGFARGGSKTPKPNEKWDESKEKWITKKVKPQKPFSSANEVGPSRPSDSDNPDKFRPGEFKRGGRTKREYGGRGPGERTQHEMKRRDAVQAATDYGVDPRVTESQLRDKTRAFEKSAEQTAYKKGGRTKKNVGGPMGMMPDPRLSMVSPTAMKFSGAQGTPYKRGGKVHSDEAEDKKLIKKMVKPSARTGKADGGKAKYLSSYDEANEKEYGKGESALDRGMNRIANEFSPQQMRKDREALKARREADPKFREFQERAKKRADKESMEKAGYEKGGRTARATGGKVKKGKTNINIIINAGKKDDGGVGMPPPPPGLPGGPMSLQRPMGGMPPGMPGMPPGAPAGGPPSMGQPPMPPMARKAGGRVTKVAKSYKDMEAGAGSGEGRLQKTDIAKRNPKPKEDGVILTKDRGYPNKVLGATGGRTAHKAGGKVYRSYKDMDAGAGSGKGRLEKEEIQKRKH